MIQTRFTQTFGVEYPVIQAGMSWVSSNAALPAAVSNAGGLGVLAAGPMYVDDFRDTLRELKASTDKPFAVNVPLYRQQAEEILDIVLEEQAPILVASQGGPKKYLDRFQSAGIKCIHVVASELHARKAADAGVDGIVVVGGEAGGHPPPEQVSTMVLTRAVARAVPDTPIIAGGGVADGYGVASALALGADAVQLGTRFLATTEARAHASYKKAVIDASIEDTALVGRGMSPIRMIKNAFSERFLHAEAEGQSYEARKEIFLQSSLKMAAFDGDPENGKLEAGQSAGLVDEILPASEVFARIIAECEASISRLAKFNVPLEGGL